MFRSVSFLEGGRRGRVALAAVVLALVGASVTGPAPTATAAEGTTLRQITAQVPSCGISTGLAFDGARLLVSCWDQGAIYAVSPDDGGLLETIPVSNIASGLGALAYDASRTEVWACDYATQNVLLIPVTGPNRGQASSVFHPSDGCIDGLAYDGTDDTLFTSGDARPTIFHWGADGSFIDSRDVAATLGGCGSSGIAVGGPELFLANNGCSQIYRSGKSVASTPQLFASYPARIEDLECDDVTFRTEGKRAIWAKDAYDAVLNAFELAGTECGFGGLPPQTPPSKPRNVAAAGGDTTLNVTWQAPADPGSGPVTGYTVEATPTGGGSTTSATTDGSTLHTTLTGLTNGQPYTVIVFAKNDSAGRGPDSDPVTGTPRAPADGNRATANLSYKNETSGSTQGYGFVAIEVTGTRLCFGLRWQKISTPTAAHIHRGAPGVNGPVEIVIFTDTPGPKATASTAWGCVNDPDAPDVIAHPDDYYVNVHTAGSPGGAIRGQLHLAARKVSSARGSAR